MATVTGYTKSKMDAITNEYIVSGAIVGDDLILTKYGGGTVNAGNVRGPVGAAGAETGTFIIGGWDVDPTGYLILDGSTVVGGAITYADLAGLFPSWVSGSDLILPNADGCAIVVDDANPGGIAGSMLHTLTSEAQLPPHTHPNSHVHSMTHGHSATSGYVSNDHTHTIPSHQHQVGGINSGQGYAYRSVAGNTGFDILNSGPNVTLSWVLNPQTSNDGGGGATSGISSNHTHGITVVGFTGNTGDSNALNTGITGEGAPIDHTPKHIKVRLAVKF